MDGDAVRRVRPSDRAQGDRTQGVLREAAVDTDGMWAGFVTTDPGMDSGWHHHGDLESTIYVLSGAMRLEFGPGGREVIDAQPGEFVYVAPHAIHREGNPTNEPATLIVARAGSGDPVTNVEGPSPG
jgi:uncharacterized RmlC-like cupin family protein